MAGNNFKDNIDALVGGMSGYLNTKTVVGEAITVGDNILLPLADISYGMGVGTFGSDDKNNGGGAVGAKIIPTAVLVINNDNARILSLKDDPDLLERIVEMAPGLINKFLKKDGKGASKDSKSSSDIFE